MTEARDETQDWATARQAWEGGASFRQAEDAVGRRLTYSRIRRRAQSEGWVQRGLTAEATVEQRRAQTAAAREAAQLRWSEEKDRVVGRLVETVDGLVDRVFAPAVRKEVKVLSGGEGMGASVEVVEVDLDSPPPADQKALVTSVAILVDKLQLLTGEATSRSESGPIADRAAAEERVRQIRDELEERRAARDAGRAEAAES